MDKFTPYFGQVVTDDELTEIFNSFSLAIEQFIQDFGYFGIAVGGDVVPNSTPNLSVQVSAPAIIYDQFGNRISVASAPVINITVDEDNQPTAVATTDYTKWLSIFIKFKRVDTDPQTDDLGETVFYRHIAGWDIHVVQGGQAPISSGATRPGLRGDEVLLADIALVKNQTAILAGDIDTTRSQVIFNIAGATSIHAKNLLNAMQQMAAVVNGITTASLQVPTINGSPNSLPAGSVVAVFTSVLNQFNALKTQVNGIVSSPSDVAHKTQTNTFTAENTFNAKVTLAETILGSGAQSNNQVNFVIADANRALLATGSVPADAAVGNRWKVIFEFKYGSTPGGGQYIRMYTGTDYDGQGVFAITANCGWTANGSSGSWKRRHPQSPAMAVLWTFNRLRISTKPALASGINFDDSGNTTWTDWPTGLPAGASADGLGLHVVDNLTVTGNARVGGNLDVNASVNADEITAATNIRGTNLKIVGSSGELFYESSRNRQIEISLASGVSGGAGGWELTPFGYWVCKDSSLVSSELWFPLYLPVNAILNSLDVYIYYGDGHTLKSYVDIHTTNWGGSGDIRTQNGGAWKNEAPDGVGDSVGWHQVNIPPDSGTDKNIKRESAYLVRFQPFANAQRVGRIRCNIVDKGYR